MIDILDSVLLSISSLFYGMFLSYLIKWSYRAYTLLMLIIFMVVPQLIIFLEFEPFLLNDLIQILLGIIFCIIGCFLGTKLYNKDLVIIKKKEKLTIL